MKGEIRLLRGRVRFVGGNHSAPFPSAIVVFRPPQYRVTVVDAAALKGHFVKHLQNRIPCLLADLSILEMLDADHEALISKLRATQEWIFKRVIRPT
jgi:hypothetical protein